MNIIDIALDFAFRNAGIVFPALLILASIVVTIGVNNSVIKPMAEISRHKGK